MARHGFLLAAGAALLTVGLLACSDSSSLDSTSDELTAAQADSLAEVITQDADELVAASEFNSTSAVVLRHHVGIIPHFFPGPPPCDPAISPDPLSNGDSDAGRHPSECVNRRARHLPTHRHRRWHLEHSHRDARIRRSHPRGHDWAGCATVDVGTLLAPIRGDCEESGAATCPSPGAHDSREQRGHAKQSDGLSLADRYAECRAADWLSARGRRSAASASVATPPRGSAARRSSGRCGRGRRWVSDQRQREQRRRFTVCAACRVR